MTTFFLIRHGDKFPIPPDPGLNELGHTQAQKTAEFLKKFPIQTILTSPLKRAQETAKYTAKALNVPVQTEAKLRERINWGDDPNLTRDEFVELWKKGTKDRSFMAPLGVSSLQAGKNLAQLIQQYASDEDRHIAFFTHGGIIADFLRNIMPDSELTSIAVNFGDHIDYEVHECSITTLRVGKTIKIESLNKFSHL